MASYIPDIWPYIPFRATLKEPLKLERWPNISLI